MQTDRQTRMKTPPTTHTACLHCNNCSVSVLSEPVVYSEGCQSGWRLSWPHHRGWPCTATVRSTVDSRRRLGEGLTAVHSSQPR